MVGEPGPAALAVIEAARARGLPVLRGRLAPDPATIATLAGSNVLAFAGIGHPEKFFATLKNAGIISRQARSFPDHHRFTKDEAGRLLQIAAQRQAGADHDREGYGAHARRCQPGAAG